MNEANPTPVRVVASSALTMFKILSASRVYVVAAIVQPIALALIATAVFSQAGGLLGGLDAALGAGAAGTWTSMLYGSAGALNRERRFGTLEGLIRAPSPLVLVVLGLSVGATAIGTASFLATLITAALTTDLALDHIALVPAVLAWSVFMVSCSALGIVFSSIFILFRQAALFQNALEYPVWILAGFFVPTSMLSVPLQRVGWLLAPAWAFRALHAAAHGRGEPFVVILAVILSLLTLVGGLYLVARFERVVMAQGSVHLR